MIVLAWLSDLPRRWNCFVANRVAKIQEILPPDKWKHASSKDNPADCASRGTSLQQLKNADLWWRGPNWLACPPTEWPKVPVVRVKNMPEEKKSFAGYQQTNQSVIEVNRFSNFNRLVRTMATVLRAVDVMRKRHHQCSDPFTVEELSSAHNSLIKEHQSVNFVKEISELTNNGEVGKKSSLKNLSPFLDSIGLLRVGGRLSQSEYSFDKRFPILIEKSSHLAWLLISKAHQQSLHSGTQQTLATLQQRYWIINGRSQVRKYVRSCVKCFNFASKRCEQKMGDLPEERVTPSRPFTFTGIDFAGPLTIKGISKRDEKAFIALFVCFSTRAIHLECVSDLSKEACLAAIRRFTSRRGLPNTIYSDNATNFIGSRNEIQEIQQMLQCDRQSSLKRSMANQGVQWVMIPPRAPHFGGLWEAGVKSVKRLLRRQMGNIRLNFEELTTLLAQIEAVLNSRPITMMSTDPQDSQVLTPGHFLLGGPLTALPDRVANDSQATPLKRWKLVQFLTQHFWKRWIKEYLLTHQIRNKWQRNSVNIQPGDLVYVAEDNISPLQWPLARVTKTFTGNDDLVRVVEVKINGKFYSRPISKLRKLPIQVTD